MDKQAIFQLIQDKSEKLCVIATVSDSAPECAVVGYAAKKDGTIIINTNKNTRKVANIRNNNKVAIVIGWQFDAKNFQYEGKAEIIERENPEFKELETFFFSVNPGAKKFESPDTILLRITPAWIKMIDLTVNPPVNQEVTL